MTRLRLLPPALPAVRVSISPRAHQLARVYIEAGIRNYSTRLERRIIVDDIVARLMASILADGSVRLIVIGETVSDDPSSSRTQSPGA